MTAVVRTDKMERPGDKWSIIGEVGHRDALHFKYHEGKSKTRDSSRSFLKERFTLFVPGKYSNFQS